MVTAARGQKLAAPRKPALAPALVERAAAGDAGALDVLAREAQPLLCAQARALARRSVRSGCMCDPEDLAAEVVAEAQAFLAAGGWGRYAKACGEGLECWLFGLVRNKLRRRLRDSRRHAALLAGEPMNFPDHIAPERSLDAARALALARALPPRERDALALWLADAPTSEIAARLRFPSAHAVDCCLSRGRQRLRALLEDPVARAA